jgi:hypothetical protein
MALFRQSPSAPTPCCSTAGSPTAADCGSRWQSARSRAFRLSSFPHADHINSVAATNEDRAHRSCPSELLSHFHGSDRRKRKRPLQGPSSSMGGRSRTLNLLIRSQVLYPIELRPLLSEQNSGPMKIAGRPAFGKPDRGSVGQGLPPCEQGDQGRVARFAGFGIMIGSAFGPRLTATACRGHSGRCVGRNSDRFDVLQEFLGYGSLGVCPQAGSSE